MIPYPVCNINRIDKNRKKRQKCKQCAETEVKVNKKQKQVSRLSFEDGCKAALNYKSNDSIHATSLMKCYLIKIKINKYDKMRKYITTHALLHAQEVENISESLNINFGDTSKTFEAELQLSETMTMPNTCKKCDILENTISYENISQIVSSSSILNLLKMLGPYEEIDTQLISFLNTDFRTCQNLLHLIPKLFTDAIIHDKLTLMAITSEVYSRHATLDIHVETGVVFYHKLTQETVP